MPIVRFREPGIREVIHVHLRRQGFRDIEPRGQADVEAKI
jgi:hypothetical protein